MARFRIPVFRVFYSLTYTILYFLTLVLLGITPVSMIWSSIQQNALQYTFMIGGAYVLTIMIAIFIYSSRLYTNRSVLAAVGKPYIPIEDEEVNRRVRKMIAKQLKRSAVVAWEGRPRDLHGEILRAEQEGLLPQEDRVRENYTVGMEVRVDPQNPPWGNIQHPGWSSPSHERDNTNPDVQFADVIAELPHLIEAKAVSLAPSDPLLTPVEGGQGTLADPIVVELLQRPGNMAMREYLTQLSYLGLIQPPMVGHDFLSQYERARFTNEPISSVAFNNLMASFAQLLSGMTALNRRIVDEIRMQNSGEGTMPMPYTDVPSRVSTPISPVTARSRSYLQPMASVESFAGSVIHTSSPSRMIGETLLPSRSETSLPSDAGSVVVGHDVDDDDG